MCCRLFGLNLKSNYLLAHSYLDFLFLLDCLQYYLQQTTIINFVTFKNMFKNIIGYVAAMELEILPYKISRCGS